MTGAVQNHNTYIYNGDEYRRRTGKEADIGFWTATITAAGLKALLPSFSKPFLKQMPKEHLNNYLYKDAFEKSIDLSGLKDKGLKYIDVSKTGITSDAEIEIMRGLNACYIPEIKAIKLNGEKATISGFHELGHAMNFAKTSRAGVLACRCNGDSCSVYKA